MIKFRKIFRPSFLLPYLREKFAPAVAKNPNKDGYTFSDLFIWRSDNNWITKYDYIPYSKLILLKNLQNYTENEFFKIIFLSHTGSLINEAKINVVKDINIEITKYLDKELLGESYGSFLIFHKNYLIKDVSKNGYISDRGYISYKYKKNNTFSYIHGNLDAISSTYMSSGLSELTFTRSTILERVYRLQYIFKQNLNYELLITNPTKDKQIIELMFLNKKREIIDFKKFKLNSLGVSIRKLSYYQEDYFVCIKSKIPLARPTIFKFKDNNFIDVFHG